MSICLAVTKTVAVSSLGLYCGIVSTATTIALISPLEALTSQLQRPIRVVLKIAGALAATSSAFFAASYFGAPPHWRHPYLLYGMLVAPVSLVYMAGASLASGGARCRRARQRKAGKPGVCPAGPHPESAAATPDHGLGDSVVDLGAKSDDEEHNAASKCPAGGSAGGSAASSAGAMCPGAAAAAAAAAAATPAASSHSRCVGHLAVLSALGVAGFVQSVLGVYGEGLFV